MTRRRGPDTPSVTEAFFGELGARGHQPLLKSASGTVRIDLVDGERAEHWHVTMRNGGVTVSRRNARADAVVRVNKATFEGMATGTVNAMAAVLRGDLVAEGDLGFGPSLPAGLSRAARRRHRPVPDPEREHVTDGLVQILDGNTFVVSDTRGDIEASPTDPTGLFLFDTRFLSRWVLTISGSG